ncbi:Acbp-1 [Aphelenchoides bicaudatus]|nr:Acbp-1 [Aphelenchoides bicaudatus]
MEAGWAENIYPTEPSLPPQASHVPQITSFDDALEQLETTKLTLAMESHDALELYALQQQVSFHHWFLIGDYYAFDETEINKLVREILAFEYIQNDINSLLFPDLRDSEQLELNALFQQATVGDNKPWNPKYFPTVSKEVWTAWSLKAGMSQRDARDEFMIRAKELADKYELKIEALSHIKKSSANEFVHRHYHYYQLPLQNEDGYQVLEY